MKKSISIILTALILMGSTASLAQEITPNFSILETDKEGHAVWRYLTEDFESTDSTHFTTDGKYPAKNAGDYQNTANNADLTKETSVSRVFSTAKQFVASLVTEADGNKALKIAPVAKGDITVQGWNVPLSANEMMITEFDFKLTQLPTELAQINAKNTSNNANNKNASGNNQTIRIAGMNDMGSASVISMFNGTGETLKFGESAGNSQVVDKNIWYTVREERYYTTDYTTEAPGTSSEYIYRKIMILDNEGNVLKEFTKNAELTSNTRDYLYHGANSVDFYKSNKMRPHFITVPGLTDGTNLINDNQIEMLVDNFEVTTYKMYIGNAEITEKSVNGKDLSIASNKKNVRLNPEFKFDFDVVFDGVVKVEKNGGEDISDCFEVKTNFNSVSLKWKGKEGKELLDTGAEYTISFLKKDTADSYCDETISFKTEEIHMLGDTEITDAVPSGENNAKTAIKIKITDPDEYPSIPVSVMAILYEGGVMKGCDKKDMTLIKGEAVEAEFAFKLPAGDNYNIGVIIFNRNPLIPIGYENYGIAGTGMFYSSPDRWNVSYNFPNDKLTQNMPDVNADTAAAMDTVLMKPVYKGLIYGNGGENDIALRAYINDCDGEYDLSEMSLVCEIVDEDDNVYASVQKDTVSEKTDITFSSKDLPMNGDYYLEASLKKNNSGALVQKQSWTIRKREESYRPKTYVDDGGYLVRDGERILPLSIIFVDTYKGSEYETKILTAPGLDTRHQKGYGTWYDLGVTENRKNAMRFYENSGKNLNLSVNEFRVGTDYNEVKKHIAADSEEESHKKLRGYLSRVVDVFKELPNLEMWYVGDEIDPVKYGEDMRWTNEIIASRDLDHPTYTAIDKLIENRPGIHAKTADILVPDPYCVTGKPDQDLSEVTRSVAYLRDTNPGKPVGVMLQGFWFDRKYGNEMRDLRGPTQQEFRNMVFQALAEGVCMINCFAYDEDQNAVKIPKDYESLEEWWNAVLAVYNEVQEIKPILLSDEKRPSYSVVNGGTWLNHTTRSYEGKSYLLLVNNQNSAKRASMNLGNVTEITGKYSGKAYRASNGKFDIELSALETEIFEYELGN